MIFTHTICREHFAGPGHPESPARLDAVLEALDDDRFRSVERREAPLATREQLTRAHDVQLRVPSDFDDGSLRRLAVSPVAASSGRAHPPMNGRETARLNARLPVLVQPFLAFQEARSFSNAATASASGFFSAF